MLKNPALRVWAVFPSAPIGETKKQQKNKNTTFG